MSEQKSSFVALVGAPNAGKSTLLNALVGSKVVIVSPKVQTTRRNVRGVVTRGDSQIVFVDTPGIFTPKRTLEKSLVKSAWNAVEDVDQIVLVVDAKRGFCSKTKNIIKQLQELNQKAILVLNKTDSILPAVLLPLTQELNETGIFTDTFMVSALKGDGVDDFVGHLCESAKQDHWFFPKEQLTDVNDEFQTAEITREKLYLALDQELPYSVAVETEKIEPSKGNSLVVHQAIYVLRESHKGIVLGNKGERIKSVRHKAGKEMARVLGKKVHLYLFVKVVTDWTEKPHIYEMLGLEYPN